MKEWVSVHLYYTEPWYNFLVYGVGDFVLKMKNEKIIKEFFFIRYWHQGPHIRLRVKCDNQNTELLRRHVDSYFTNYFNVHPSKNLTTKLIDNQLPNNSIQYIPYAAEIDRYGGKQALEIAEKQFEASSQVVLSIMKSNKTWNYNEALGKGLYLHLSFAYATGMDLAEAETFFKKIFEMWLPKSDNSTSHQIILKAFVENYELQKTSIMNSVQKLWLALQNKFEIEQQWLKVWIDQMAEISNRLQQVQKNNNFITPGNFKNDGTLNIDSCIQQRWYVYYSYVHMTNNRLGILNRDEGYLAYILMRGFENLKILES